MKHLTDYIEKKQSKAFKKYGAFFAFGQKQFNEKRKEGVKYMNLGLGLICPSENASKLCEKLNKISKKGIKQDLRENGVDGVIVRELYNHECFYSGEWRNAIDALEGYNITEEQIYQAYCKELINQEDED